MGFAIDVKGLNKHFGPKHVVRDVGISVEEGHITGFLGPNGSGKTTTLRLLCGLLTPDSGEGTVLGLDFRRDSRQIKLQTGYMTQKFSLYDDLSIRENLTFMAQIHGLAGVEGRVDAALERLGLAHRQHQLAGALSGGWKQRLALAVSTIHEPRLLLLDEPTAGVDPQARREFWDDIHRLAADGLTVLVSTHYMDEAERCHDIGYILAGRLIARGTAEAILADSGLVTYAVQGPGVAHVIAELVGKPGLVAASMFGLQGHVSATDRVALDKAVGPYRKAPLVWEEISPSLEDVFIQMMANQVDDRYAEA